MNRRRDKPLIKLYKDLMITRRDLIDLKESITNTINSIKESNQRLRLIELERKRRQETHQQLRQNSCHRSSSYQLKIRAKCQHCLSSFPTNEALQAHKKDKHQICEDCQQVFTDMLEDHVQFTCGQTEVECESCNILVKRKVLDSHVKVCCYRECYKCKQNIYFRAHAFHLQECKRTQNLIPSCRQFLKSRQTNQSLILPCCLVIDA